MGEAAMAIQTAQQVAFGLNMLIQAGGVLASAGFGDPEQVTIHTKDPALTFDEKRLAQSDAVWQELERNLYTFPIRLVRHTKLRKLSGAAAMPVGEAVGLVQFARRRSQNRVLSTTSASQRTTLDKLNIALNKKKIKLQVPLAVACEVVRIQRPRTSGNEVGMFECYHLRVTIAKNPSYEHKLINRFHEAIELDFTFDANGTDDRHGSSVKVSWMWTSHGHPPLSLPGTKHGSFVISLDANGVPSLTAEDGDGRRLMIVDQQTPTPRRIALYSEGPNSGRIGELLENITGDSTSKRGKWRVSRTEARELATRYIKEYYGVPTDSIAGQTRLTAFFRQVKAMDWMVFLVQSNFLVDTTVKNALNDYMRVRSTPPDAVAKRVKTALDGLFDNFARDYAASEAITRSDLDRARNMAVQANRLIGAAAADIRDQNDPEDPAVKQRDRLARSGVIEVIRFSLAEDIDGATAWYEKRVSQYGSAVALFYALIKHHFNMDPVHRIRAGVSPPPRPLRRRNKTDNVERTADGAPTSDTSTRKGKEKLDDSRTDASWTFNSRAYQDNDHVKSYVDELVKTFESAGTREDRNYLVEEIPRVLRTLAEHTSDIAEGDLFEWIERIVAEHGRTAALNGVLKAIGAPESARIRTVTPSGTDG